MSSKATVSLCVCTYNDHHLVNGLLAELPLWSKKPTEIIVLDDASEVPYKPPATAKPRIARLPSNSGPAVAKQTALDMAEGNFLLMLDSDARPHPLWLEKALSLFAEPQTDPPLGLIGCSLLNDVGDGPVGRYMRRHCNNILADGPHEFIPGPVWLMPAQVWHSSGGFKGYAGRTHEDHHFCRLLSQTGYQFLATGPAARQTRLLSRAGLAARHLAWHMPTLGDMLKLLLAAEANQHAIVQYICMTLLDLLKDFFSASLIAGEIIFIYLELLIFITMAAWLADKTIPGQSETMFRVVLKTLAAYPMIGEYLRKDLAALGYSLPLEFSAGTKDQETWLSGLFFLDSLGKAGVFAKIERQMYLFEDEKPDFSFYLS